MTVDTITAPDAAEAYVLPSEPQLSPAAARASSLGRRAFRLLNRWVTVPLLRAGLGPWLGTPVGGWVLLLGTRGRVSGHVHHVPLSYLIADGSVWVLAGFGRRCDWYRNVLADPSVEVTLPGRTRACIAEEMRHAAVRQRIIPRLVRATGVPGYLTGCDPFRASPERLLAATAWLPLIRLRPVGEPLVAGPDDPGGLGWIWRQAVVLIIGGWLIGSLRQAARRSAASGQASR